MHAPTNSDAPTITLSDPINERIVFYCQSTGQEMMSLDKDGMTYKGQRIEDAGEVRLAFLDAVNQWKK